MVLSYKIIGKKKYYFFKKIITRKFMDQYYIYE